jgi:ATP-dependent exoDNAse (exonuclease V) alpha subunit
VSQSAAEVLAGEAQVQTENTAKWLYETRRRPWQLPPRALVIIDEASMVATSDLVDLVEQARRPGGRVLLVRDPAQLAAIHIGGPFDLLADRHGAATAEIETGRVWPVAQCGSQTKGCLGSAHVVRWATR